MANFNFFRFIWEAFIPIFSLVFLLIVTIVIFNTVKTVPEGMEYTVERFGKYSKTLGPGLAIIVPFMDRIGYKVNLRERKVAVQFSELKTKDNAEIKGSADIYVRVIDTHKLAYETGDSDTSVRQKCELEMLKLCKSMTQDAVLSSADKIDAALLGAVKQHEKDWGLDVRYIDVHKIYPA